MQNNSISEVSYNSEHQVVFANDLIRSKQEDLSLLEAKLVRLMVMQVVREDKDLKTYSCKITSLAKFLGLPKNNIYSAIKKVSKGLMKKTIEIIPEEEKYKPDPSYKSFHWVDEADYDRNTGTITLKLSERLKPYLIGLYEKFTQYQYTEILTLSSTYAIRFYELISSFNQLIFEKKMQDKSFTLTVEYLRRYFNCENKYPNNGNFLIKVIDSAVDEMNKKTNFLVSYERVKDGRKIVAIEITCDTNYDVVLPRLKEKNMLDDQEANTKDNVSTLLEQHEQINRGKVD